MATLLKLNHLYLITMTTNLREVFPVDISIAFDTLAEVSGVRVLHHDADDGHPRAGTRVSPVNPLFLGRVVLCKEAFFVPDNVDVAATFNDFDFVEYSFVILGKRVKQNENDEECHLLLL